MDELNELRKQIDQVDSQITSLLNMRLELIEKVLEIKKKHNIPIFNRVREAGILKHVKSLINDPLHKEEIESIFKKILENSKKDQQFLQFSSFPFSNVGIIGLGLIGGSICKAIKLKTPNIKIGKLFHASEKNFNALEYGWVDEEYTSIEEFLQNYEFIILAVPISITEDYAKEIHALSKNLNKKLIVIDILSVKQKIVKLFEELTNDKIEFIGTHPMSGKEKMGFSASQPTLFIGNPWVVVPHEKNTKKSLDKINDLISFLGSNVIYLSIEDHDFQAAIISHIPYILSKAYLDFVNNINPESLKIAGPGFSSFTRIADSNLKMRNEIEIFNYENIHKYLMLFIEEILKKKF